MYKFFIKKNIMRLGLPSKFRFLDKYFSTNQSFILLDIGAGNHSAANTKKWFPKCVYHGVDREKDYNNSETDLKLMDQFYEMDLTLLNFHNIPDNYYDAIMMAHVIEHLPNGTEVIKALVPKLKPGGLIYIEYPGIKSTTLPSKRGTLNFFDDNTHCRIYTKVELYNTLMSASCTPIKGGTRRDFQNMLLLPIKLFHNKIKYGYVMGSVFWDLLGFAEFVLARKK
ncbi:SAM-dependent methyltransferase [Sporocytophaga myxococcoides]|uniref:SAM-dependent methyltransferase n=2 Tax=Sporocytophaga myxococcoides TaxID=153721 RepID=A0A098LJV5_9BACT|nr:SAM-dependent methyltransferase [Sporocytophaga myxococcoides]